MSDLPRLLLPSEPEPVPITHMFDSFGDETDSWDECDAFVAGPLADGTWLSAPAEHYRLTKLS